MTGDSPESLIHQTTGAFTHELPVFTNRMSGTLQPSYAHVVYFCPMGALTRGLPALLQTMGDLAHAFTRYNQVLCLSSNAARRAGT